jgi:hypothetical protein
MSSLPDPRTLLTTLFSTLPTQSEETPSSTTAPTFENLPPNAKPLLLTLHVLYPNELLPALDLLDRNLLTRFVVPEPDTRPPTNEEEQQVNPSPSLSPSASLETPKRRQRTPLYYVRSSQQARQYHTHSRHAQSHSDQPIQHYEVRPLAWNCSCPAFAFSAFPASSIGSASGNEEDIEVHTRRNILIEEEGEECEFGGLSRGDSIPLCKHLLACVLVERWDVFSGYGVEEKEVSVEELAGWAAGWGG